MRTALCGRPGSFACVTHGPHGPCKRQAPRLAVLINSGVRTRITALIMHRAFSRARGQSWALDGADRQARRRRRQLRGRCGSTARSREQCMYRRLNNLLCCVAALGPGNSVRISAGSIDVRIFSGTPKVPIKTEQLEDREMCRAELRLRGHAHRLGGRPICS
jgi:hypothetical protein